MMNDDDKDGFVPQPQLCRPHMWNGARPTPGVSVDRIDVRAGLVELSKFWAGAPLNTVMLVEYALMRWARGEEEAAERMVIDKATLGAYALDFTSWRRVLAAARAGGEAAASQQQERGSA